MQRGSPRTEVTVLMHKNEKGLTFSSGPAVWCCTGLGCGPHRERPALYAGHSSMPAWEGEAEGVCVCQPC